MPRVFGHDLLWPVGVEVARVWSSIGGTSLSSRGDGAFSGGAAPMASIYQPFLDAMKAEQQFTPKVMKTMVVLEILRNIIA